MARELGMIEKKDPRGLKDQHVAGSHLVGKPSEQSQPRCKDWEGTGYKTPSFEQRNFRSCFGSGEKGYFIAQCAKNMDFG